MEIEIIRKIDDYHNYLENIFDKFSRIYDGYYQYRIPSIEEYQNYRDKISDNIIRKIWNDDLDRKKKKLKFFKKKNNIITKDFLDTDELVIPQLRSSDLLLVKEHLFQQNNYRGIISVNMNHIPEGKKIEYYDIKYFTKKKNTEKEFFFQGYPY